MREIDMIPASYRERQQIKRWCQQSLMVFIVLSMAIVVTRLSVTNQTQSINSRMAGLQKNKSFNLQQQQTYNALVAEEARLQKNLEILKGLRGGPAVREILQVIDRVLDGKVWFDHWSFNRAGEITEVKPQTVQTGYFIIIPQNTAGNATQQAWRLNTHMEIKGQAIDHVSLSEFVRKLIRQPEIEDVQVVNTASRQYVEYQVVDFNLIVIINNQFGAEDV